MLVLEELEHARARGATILAELTGYGLSSDALHVTEPDPTGVNPARAITMALADAGRDPDDVDYVNAHGTSTPVGDASETRVLKRVFGRSARTEVPVSSTKSMTGHMLGAAGRHRGRLLRPGASRRTSCRRRSTCTTPIPTCDLDYVPERGPRGADVDVAISNGFGFGGHNACLVIERFAE